MKGRPGAPWLPVHEYDPLLQQQDTVKYRINSLDDPTKRDMYKTLKAGGGGGGVCSKS